MTNHQFIRKKHNTKQRTSQLSHGHAHRLSVSRHTCGYPVLPTKNGSVRKLSITRFHIRMASVRTWTYPATETSDESGTAKPRHCPRWHPRKETENRGHFSTSRSARSGPPYRTWCPATALAPSSSSPCAASGPNPMCRSTPDHDTPPTPGKSKAAALSRGLSEFPGSVPNFPVTWPPRRFASRGCPSCCICGTRPNRPAAKSQPSDPSIKKCIIRTIVRFNFPYFLRFF